MPRRPSRRTPSRRPRAPKGGTYVVTREGKRIRGHWRTIRLRNGGTTKFFVREHVRTGKKAHRLSGLPQYPLFQREMIDRWASQTRAATSDQPDETYISPEERAAQGYMDRQRRMIFQHRRR